MKVYEVTCGESFVMSLVLGQPLEAEKALSLKILVVDDDPLGRRLMHLILTNEGHKVDLAANGLEAVEAVKEKQFDISQSNDL